MPVPIPPPFRALAWVCLLAAPMRARAGDYTLADVVASSEKGLVTGVLLGMVESPATPWMVDGPMAVRLLRARVPAEVIAEMSGGLHPTAAEKAEATQPGPAWTAGEAVAPPGVGRPVLAYLTDGTHTSGQFVALTDANLVLEGADGVVSVLRRERVRSVTVVEPAVAAPEAGSRIAVVPEPAEGASAPEGPTTDAPVVPVLTGIPAAEQAPSGSSYRDLIAHQAGPTGPETLSTAHIEGYRQGNQLVWAGLGESLASVVVLASIGAPSNGGNPGLRGLGVGLAALGTGSMVTGSLISRYASTADGYTITPAPGWIGAGSLGLGILGYVGGGEDTPSPAVVGLLATGGALGLVQAAVNGGQRERATRTTGAITPLVVPGGTGLQVSGSF